MTWQSRQLTTPPTMTRQGITNASRISPRLKPIAIAADGRTPSVHGVRSRNGIGISRVGVPNSAPLNDGMPM